MYQVVPAFQVLANLRKELFRCLLLQKVQFFDVHSANELTALISSELDSVRSFVFRNVSRDRGPRAILEVRSSSFPWNRDLPNFIIRFAEQDYKEPYYPSGLRACGRTPRLATDKRP